MPKEKIWNVGDRENGSAEAQKIAQTLGIGYPTAYLLVKRGYRTPEAAASFIRLENELFHDPFLLPDMEKAVNRIKTAIKNGEKTVIYGDYDVDGVTSVSLLYLYLTSKGASVSYYIPNRVGEGYGVNAEAIDKLANEGNTLMITVDTGVTAIDEAKYCASLGCDMVITDHHECREELPDAVAVVNPKRPDSIYPFSSLAGVGVAFKLITALEISLARDSGTSEEEALKRVCEYVDLAALGTVADVMPLRDENRLIVSMGLSLMEKRPRHGIKALLDAAENGKSNGKKRKITSSTVGFTLAPRINAAGRMATAVKAVELFLSPDPEGASLVAEELCRINVLRQNEENKIVEELRERIEHDPLLKNSAVMVLENEGWNHGVIGIVSSRVTEKYGKPSILISLENGMGKGSGRSVPGLNLVEALSYCSSLLEKYGGHELAAGLTVREENLADFRDRINEYATTRLGTSEPQVSLDIDCELYPSEIGIALASELELLEPCGVDNPVPTFASFGLEIAEMIPMGQGKHTKFILSGEGKRFAAVMFGTAPESTGFVQGDCVDIAYRLGINEYMGNRSEQVLIRDVRLNRDGRDEGERLYGEYAACLEGECPVRAEWIPVRADFISVYLHLKRTLPSEGGRVGVRELLHSLSGICQGEKPINYVKLRLILDILKESGIITLDPADVTARGRESFEITVPKVETKVDLERSWLYSQLTSPKRRSTTD